MTLMIKKLPFPTNKRIAAEIHLPTHERYKSWNTPAHTR